MENLSENPVWSRLQTMVSLSISPESHLDHLADLSDEETEAVLTSVRRAWADFCHGCPPGSQGPWVLAAVSPVEFYSTLVGPVAGDPPVPEEDVVYRVRPGRQWASRMVSNTDKYKPKATNNLVVVVGPHQGLPYLLYTVYPAPAAHREPGDTHLTGDDLENSRAFWRIHALI